MTPDYLTKFDMALAIAKTRVKGPPDRRFYDQHLALVRDHLITLTRDKLTQAYHREVTQPQPATP